MTDEFFDEKPEHRWPLPYAGAIENFHGAASQILWTVDPESRDHPICYERLYDPEELQPALAELEQARQQVDATLPEYPDMFLPAGFADPRKVSGYVARVCFLLNSFGTRKTDSLELGLLMEVINRARDGCDLVQLEDWIQRDPRNVVQFYAHAIDDLAGDALEAVGTSYEDFSPESGEWLKGVLLDTWGYAEQRLYSFMSAGIDKWIHPRLGLPPDQWTTDLSRVLAELRRIRQWCCGLHRLGDFPDSFHRVTPEKSDTISVLCAELEGFAEQLGTLRFDSVKASTMTEGEQAKAAEVPTTAAPDPSTQDRTPDKITDKSKKRIPRAKERIPRNPKVRRLCHLLKTGLAEGRNEIEIAREFLGKDYAKAEDYLRQARRFSELWKPDTAGQEPDS